MSAVGEREPPSGRAAIWVEADTTQLGTAPFAGNRHQRHCQVHWELPHRSRADLEAMRVQIDLKADRPIAHDCFRTCRAQSGYDLRSRTAQPEPSAPWWLVANHQDHGEAEDSQGHDDLK